MCGRYTLAGDWHEFTKEFELEEVPDLVPRFNISPSHGPGYEVPIVLTGRELALARFWYIPAWWNEPLKKLPTSYNARSESATASPFFRTAQRCLVPASGFREFPGLPGKKRAVAFERREQGVAAPRFFAFGGLTDEWHDPHTGEVVRSFAILTTEPNRVVRPYHDRMPLMVARGDYDTWLNPRVPYDEALEAAVRESKECALFHYECSTYGNNSRHEGPACIAPVPEQKTLFD